MLISILNQVLLKSYHFSKISKYQEDYSINYKPIFNMSANNTLNYFISTNIYVSNRQENVFFFHFIIL